VCAWHGEFNRVVLVVQLGLIGVCSCERCVCVCEWHGEFNRVVLVVQLGLIVYFLITFYLCKMNIFFIMP
jgi:hypothetical protein